jgi:hypothetical protein
MDTLSLDLHLVRNPHLPLLRPSRLTYQRIRQCHNLPNNLHRSPDQNPIWILHPPGGSTRQVHLQSHGRLPPRLRGVHHSPRLFTYGSHVWRTTISRTTLPIRSHDHLERMARRPPLHPNPSHHDLQRRTPCRRQRRRHLCYILDYPDSSLRRRMHCFCTNHSAARTQSHHAAFVWRFLGRSLHGHEPQGYQTRHHDRGQERTGGSGRL